MTNRGTMFVMLCVLMSAYVQAGVKTGLENAGMNNWHEKLREDCVRPALNVAVKKATQTETYKEIVSDVNRTLSDLESTIRPYYNQIVQDAQKARQTIELAQGEYEKFKTQFDRMRQELEESQKTLSGLQGEQDNDDLEKKADDEKKQVEAENKAAEEQEKKGSAETLSEAAQKAVDDERKKRKEAAEAKARAEGKDPSKATWDDLTDEEIAEIADAADGLETVSDEDRAESDKVKEHLP